MLLDAGTSFSTKTLRQQELRPNDGCSTWCLCLLLHHCISLILLGCDLQHGSNGSMSRVSPAQNITGACAGSNIACCILHGISCHAQSSHIALTWDPGRLSCAFGFAGVQRGRYCGHCHGSHMQFPQNRAAVVSGMVTSTHGAGNRGQHREGLPASNSRTLPPGRHGARTGAHGTTVTSRVLVHTQQEPLMASLRATMR